VIKPDTLSPGPLKRARDGPFSGNPLKVTGRPEARRGSKFVNSGKKPAAGPEIGKKDGGGGRVQKKKSGGS